MLSGTRANIAVKIFGDDLPTLRRLGEHVRDVMAGVPGAVDVSLEQQMDVPVVRFVLNRPAIARYGLRADEVAEAVETAFAGATVGRIFDRGGGVRSGREIRPGGPGRLRAARRSADRHAQRRGGSRSGSWRTSGARKGPTWCCAKTFSAESSSPPTSRAATSAASSSDMRDGGAAGSARCRRAIGWSTAVSSRAGRARSRRLLVLGVARRRRAVHAARAGVRAAARRVARHAEPAARADRRCRRRVPRGRRAERGVDDRVHHAVRHRDAQRDHARVAHPSPDGGRRVSPIFARRWSAAPASGSSRS